MGTRAALVAALFLSISFIPPAFGADPAAANTRADEAKAHYEAGSKAAEAGDWTTAREELAAAWEAMPHYKIAWALGAAEIELGKYRDAVAHLEACLSQGQRLTAAQRGEIEAMLADARAKLVALRIRVAVPGAEVLVNGEVVGTTPLDRDIIVDPGPKKIAARKAGFKFVPVSVSAASGETIDARLVAVKPPQAPSLQPQNPDAAEPGSWKPLAIAGGATVAAAGIVTGTAVLVLSSDPAAQRYGVGACAVGGVATLATLIVAAWPTGKKPAVQKSGMWVAPIVNGLENGFAVGGSF